MRRVLRAALVGAIVLSAATLARAQQDDPDTPTPPKPAAAPKPPPALKPPEPANLLPITPPTKPAAEDQSDDDTPVSSAPARSSTPRPPPVPLKRPRFGVAIIQALDKVTAETERFEVPLNTPIRYKTLIFTVQACETTASDESSVDAVAHVEVISQPKAPEGGSAPPARQVFKGWMFANSPGVALLQHPIYDAWLIACKTALPPA
jgi:hypothetical protein